MLPAFTMQRPSASRAENYQFLWDTIASLKQCEQAMQHAFIPVRKIYAYFPSNFNFSPFYPVCGAVKDTSPLVLVQDKYV